MFYRLKKKIKKNLEPYRLAYQKILEGYGKLDISFIDVIIFYNFYKRRDELNEIKTTLFKKPIIAFNNYFWYYHCISELFIEEVYKCNFKTQNPVILDCGANIGLSVIYFKRKYPKAKITAFEPDVTLFEKLKLNLKSFDILDVELINKGLWKEKTTLKFLAEGDLGGGIVEDHLQRQNIVEINVESLRPYLKTKIDFLKIDIEGAEYEVLNDIKFDLKSVENLFIEYHGEGKKVQKLHEMLAWIHSSGFRYHIKSAWENQKYPFIEKRSQGRDLQLNIFCYR